MASSTRANALPQFILTPQQQNLLFRALTSNQPATNDKSPEGNTLSPQSLTTSPTQNQNNSGLDLTEGLQESPFVDYDYDFGPDGSFDFDFNADGNAKMIGDLPGSGGSESSKDDSKSSSPENESSDKRGHPDEDDDDDIEEGGGKRREGEGKVPKKPGRKPLTNEPSSVSIFNTIAIQAMASNSRYRRGRLRIVRLNVPFESVRKGISRTWKRKWKNSRRHRTLQTTRTAN